MSKCLVLFVEGDTEVEFYKKVIANARDKRSDRRFDTSIECRNVNGVGGFKNIALRKFVKEIKPKYDENCIFTVVLCSDTDVFELSQKPPVKWDEVRKDMIQNGASKVITVKAKHSIEDWFLYDADNIVSFLSLKKGTKITGSTGYDKLMRLYRMANKVYYKGMKSNGMVEKLDIDKISESVKEQIAPLYKALGVTI